MRTWTLLRHAYQRYVSFVSPHRYLIRQFIGRAAFVKPSGVCLDIGAGAAPFRAQIMKLGLSRYVKLDVAPYGSDTIPADAARLPFRSKSVDLIVSFETIQHIADFQAMLKECARVTTRNGLLMLSYPFVYGECDVRDFHRWTQEGMQRDLEVAGFTVIAHVTKGGVALTATSFLELLFRSLMPGRRAGWRMELRLNRVLIEMAFAIVTLPLTLLSRMSVVLDQALPTTSLYVGGIVLARRHGN